MIDDDANSRAERGDGYLELRLSTTEEGTGDVLDALADLLVAAVQRSNESHGRRITPPQDQRRNAG
jgi:hypothetical protein